MSEEAYEEREEPTSDVDEVTPDLSIIPLTDVDTTRAGVRLSTHHEEKLSGEAKTKIVEILSSDKWSSELRDLASKELTPHVYSDEAITDFEKRLNFIQENVPVQLLKDPEIQLVSLLRVRSNYLEQMREQMGEDEWLKVLNDPKKSRDFRLASLASTLSHLSDEEYAELEARPAVTLKAEKRVEERLDELRDVLETTGIDEIAKPIVNDIILMEPSDSEKADGLFKRKPADVTLTIHPDKKAFLIPILMHEIGHAFMDKIAPIKKAQDIFDRYIIIAQLEPTENSIYANAKKLSKGKHDAEYQQESFAEDFKAFWMKPESLSERKLAIFDELCDLLYPDIDRDKVRKQIKSVLGNYYGVNVNDVLVFAKCKTSAQYAEYLDRKNSEDARKKKSSDFVT